MGFASKSYYEILDIDPAATADDVQKSYTTVKATWDPGSVATYSLYSPAESELISRKIEEAYQLLMNPERRRRYDLYRRFMESRLGEAMSAESFWEAVEQAECDGPASLEKVSELLSTGPVDELFDATRPTLADASRRIASRPDVEREWRELVDGKPAAAPPAPAPGRVAAATESPYREAPVAKTWVSPTAQSVTPGSGWRRPERMRAKSPRPTRLKELPVDEATLQGLEATHGPSGALLKAVREAKGISVEAIADHTKIGSMYIKDIEREAFGSLPPAVYLRGFVNQYVKLLRLDVGRIVDAYMARFEAATAPPTDLL